MIPREKNSNNFLLPSIELQGLKLASFSQENETYTLSQNIRRHCSVLGTSMATGKNSRDFKNLILKKLIG